MSEVEIKDPQAVLDALERAKADAKKYREQYEALQAEHEPLVEKYGALQEELKTSAIRRKIEAEGADPDRVLKFLKTDDVKYEDGKVEGFEDAFKTLKTELPELFDAKRRVGGKVELETGSANIQRTPSEIQADRLLRIAN